MFRKEIEELKRKINELEEVNRILKLEKEEERKVKWEAINRASKLIECVRLTKGQIVIFKGIEYEVASIDYKEMKVRFVTWDSWVEWKNITFPRPVCGEREC